MEFKCKCGEMVKRGKFSKHLSSAIHYNYIKSVEMENYIVVNGYKKTKYSNDIISNKKVNHKRHGGSVIKNMCQCENCITKNIEAQIKKKIDNNKK